MCLNSACFAENGNAYEYDEQIDVKDEAIGIGEYIGAGEDGPGELTEKIHQDKEGDKADEAGASDDGAAVFVATFAGKNVEDEEEQEGDAGDGVNINKEGAVHKGVEQLIEPGIINGCKHDDLLLIDG